MTVWKVGSRWNETGAPGNSVLTLFERHGVVFTGSSRRLFERIKPGDLLAITDGTRVMAIGRVTSSPMAITKFDFHGDLEMRGYVDDGVVACRAAITPLEEADRFQAFSSGAGRRGVCQMPTIGDKIKEIHARYQQELAERKQFTISARSAPLVGSSDCLLRGNTRLRVPVYQRPFSWPESQVRRFLTDALSSFRGTDGNSEPEPMFIGTMQLSAPRGVDDAKKISEQEVIDGQQRLSTLLVLLRVLQKMSGPDAGETLRHLRLDWLKTNVNGGIQHKYLVEFLEADPPWSDADSLNPYLRCAAILKEGLDRPQGDGADDADGPRPTDLNAFAEYLLTRVYFVVVETRAGLSKTLQIFDAINTAGLDLGAGDVFKVRFYEYLHVVKGHGEEVFHKIDKIYTAIDQYNKEFHRQVSSIDEVLALYQPILIARHDLRPDLHKYSSGVFWERLLDALLQVNIWDGFQNAKGVEVAYDDLERLVEARYAWEKWMGGATAEIRCAAEFVRTSRYGRFWIYAVLFMFRYGEKNAASFLLQLAKLLVVYSTIHGKALYEVSKTFWGELAARMFAEQRCDATELISMITKRIGDQKECMEKALGGPIAGSPTVKYLLCRLSAMLQASNFRTMRNGSADKFIRDLFWSEVDIEHIESVLNKDGSKREEIWEKWGDNLNGIGNLMVLDRGLNRSISNGDYVKTKLPAYAKSRFQIARQQREVFRDWGLDQCLVRKEREIKKLMGYIMEGPPPDVADGSSQAAEVGNSNVPS